MGYQRDQQGDAQRRGYLPPPASHWSEQGRKCARAAIDCSNRAFASSPNAAVLAQQVAHKHLDHTSQMQNARELQKEIDRAAGRSGPTYDKNRPWNPQAVLCSAPSALPVAVQGVVPPAPRRNRALDSRNWRERPSDETAAALGPAQPTVNTSRLTGSTASFVPANAPAPYLEKRGVITEASWSEMEARAARWRKAASESRVAELRGAEEARRAEEWRRAEDLRRAAELKRAEELKRAQELRRAEELKRAEEMSRGEGVWRRVRRPYVPDLSKYVRPSELKRQKSFSSAGDVYEWVPLPVEQPADGGASKPSTGNVEAGVAAETGTVVHDDEDVGAVVQRIEGWLSRVRMG